MSSVKEQSDKNGESCVYCVVVIRSQVVRIFGMFYQPWVRVYCVVVVRSQVVRIFGMFYQPWVRVFVDVRGIDYDLMKPTFTDSRRLFR